MQAVRNGIDMIFSLKVELINMNRNDDPQKYDTLEFKIGRLRAYLMPYRSVVSGPYGDFTMDEHRELCEYARLRNEEWGKIRDGFPAPPIPWTNMSDMLMCHPTSGRDGGYGWS